MLGISIQHRDTPSALRQPDPDFIDNVYVFPIMSSKPRSRENSSACRNGDQVCRCWNGVDTAFSVAIERLLARPARTTSIHTEPARVPPSRSQTVVQDHEIKQRV